MAFYTIHGKAGVLEVAKAESVCDYLAANLPNFKFDLVMKLEDEWNGYVEELMKNLDHTSSSHFQEEIDTARAYLDKVPELYITRASGRYIGPLESFLAEVKHRYKYEQEGDDSVYATSAQDHVARVKDERQREAEKAEAQKAAHRKNLLLDSCGHLSKMAGPAVFKKQIDLLGAEFKPIRLALGTVYYVHDQGLKTHLVHFKAAANSLKAAALKEQGDLKTFLDAKNSEISAAESELAKFEEETKLKTKAPEPVPLTEEGGEEEEEDAAPAEPELSEEEAQEMIDEKKEATEEKVSEIKELIAEQEKQVGARIQRIALDVIIAGKTFCDEAAIAMKKFRVLSKNATAQVKEFSEKVGAEDTEESKAFALMREELDKGKHELGVIDSTLEGSEKFPQKGLKQAAALLETFEGVKSTLGEVQSKAVAARDGLEEALLAPLRALLESAELKEIATLAGRYQPRQKKIRFQENEEEEEEEEIDEEVKAEREREAAEELEAQMRRAADAIDEITVANGEAYAEKLLGKCHETQDLFKAFKVVQTGVMDDVKKMLGGLASLGKGYARLVDTGGHVVQMCSRLTK